MIDGTFAIDGDFMKQPGVASYNESIGGRKLYITNNSVKAEKDYIEKFKKWNISPSRKSVVTASYATCKYLKEHYEDKETACSRNAVF